MTKNSVGKTSFQIGDIILAPFPFADHSVTKLRPAIIVSALPNDAWLVIYITSTIEGQANYDVMLEPSETNQLKVTSLARVNRLTVIATCMVDRVLGSLSPTEKKLIGEKLGQLSTEFINN